MSTLTIIWIALPFFVGFISYLLPRCDRIFSFGVAIVSTIYALWLFTQPPLTLQLLDNFGVTLLLDRLSGFFILTNALVTAAVILYCWNSSKTAFFYMQTIILHGSVNAAFACTDFISLYVALEVISIAALPLPDYPKRPQKHWR